MKFSPVIVTFALVSSVGTMAPTIQAFSVTPSHRAMVLPSCPLPTCGSFSTRLFYNQEGREAQDNSLPDFLTIFESPVLQQVYPKLLEYKDQYGHPNIPLGSLEGRQCQTLRRLHIQNKLKDYEIDWLTNLGFAFYSLEDVYRDANFNDLFQRLVDYHTLYPQSNFQIPKQYPQDPELGAWVTGIRRLGPDSVNPEHERRLNAIGFVWKSQSKCGSKFMNQYRILTQQVEEKGMNVVLCDPKTIVWVQAQQEALKKGNLSQTRMHYMGQLFGDAWTTI